jgi:methylglutaconyl-CoA hydratase
MSEPIAEPFVELGLEPEGHVVLEASLSGVATVRLNRPERRNAFDALTIRALTEAFETLHAADHVRVVFLRGTGGSFSAGADLDWMRSAADASVDDNREDAMNLARMLKALHDVPALTVALVEGPAYGGGAGLVAACDMALAVRGASFAFSEVKLGLTPATISPYVVAAIGPRASKALFATGRVFDAEAARGYGLVDEVVADAAELELAQARIAGWMVPCAPGAVADAKRLVDAVVGREIDGKLMADTARRIADRRASAEGREGVAAFLGRRKPEWAAEPRGDL